MDFTSENLIPMIIVAIATVAFYLLKHFHTQAMNKFDALIDSIGKMNARLGIHGEKLDAGTREFVKIEEHQKIQDVKIQELKEDVMLIKAGAINLPRNIENHEQVPRT